MNEGGDLRVGGICDVMRPDVVGHTLAVPGMGSYRAHTTVACTL